MWKTLLNEISQSALREATYEFILSHDQDEDGAGAATQIDPPPAKHELRLLKYYRGSMYRIYNFLQQHGRLPSEVEFNDIDLYFFNRKQGQREVGEAQARMTWGGIKVLQAFLSRSTIVTPMIVYRGVNNYNEFGGTFNPQKAQSIQMEPIPARRTAVFDRLVRDRLIGHTTTYRKFLSTSRSVRGADSFNFIGSPALMWRFLVPAGTPGLDVMKWIGSNWSENEILFPTGATATVIGVHSVNELVLKPTQPQALPVAERQKYFYTPRELEHILSAYPVAGRVMNEIYFVTATLSVPTPVPQTLPLPTETTNGPVAEPGVGTPRP